MIRDPSRRTLNPFFYKLVFITLIFALVFYVLGVSTGFITKNILEKKFDKEFNELSYSVDQLEQKLNDVKLRDDIVNLLTSNETERCKLLSYKWDFLLSDLSYFWSILPYRIEEYSLLHKESKKFKDIKIKFTWLLLESWITTKKLEETCGYNLIPILYFYDSQCYLCPSQGKELDKVREYFNTKNYSVIVFSIDLSLDDSLNSIKFLKYYYNITSTPAIILFDKKFEGKVYNSSHIISLIEGEIK